MKVEFQRPQAAPFLRRLTEPRRFIQVLAGPRQVGKTTLARQVAASLRGPTQYASADEPTLQGRAWIEQQWDIARLAASRTSKHEAILILDEIQKIQSWSEVVKRLWDEDTRSGAGIKVVLLGSAPLLLQHGLTESLAGRFEITYLPHWSYAEMRDAFGWDIHQYLFHGGYPGAAPLIEDVTRWGRYVADALIETTISRDILLMTRVDKPALLRRLFQLGCAYSSQVLSYQKMIGQLQDAGNTTTLATYLELLTGAGMLIGLQKFAGEAVRQRGSSPKLQVMNTALVSAPSGHTLATARSDTEFWGRLCESAVGAYLINQAWEIGASIYYWRDRNREVDFVVETPRTLTAIEVKSSRVRGELPGMQAFASAFQPHRQLLVGGQGIPLEEFLARPLSHWTA